MYRQPEDDSATSAPRADYILSNLAARTAGRSRYSPPLRSNTEESAANEYDSYSTEVALDREQYPLDGPVDPYLATFTKEPYHPRYESSNMPLPSAYAPYHLGELPQPSSVNGRVSDSYPRSTQQGLGRVSPGRGGAAPSSAVVPNAYPAPVNKQENTPISNSITANASSTAEASGFQRVEAELRQQSTTIPVPNAYSTPSLQVPSSRVFGGIAPYERKDTPQEIVTDPLLSWDTSVIDITLASMKPVSDNILSFSQFRICESDGPSFTDRFRLESLESNAGLLMVIIEGWRPWFLQDFRTSLPEFPLESLLYFGTEGGPAMLPLVDNEEDELSCVVEHINIYQGTEKSEGGSNLLDLGITKAHRQPLVLWTRRRGRTTYLGFQPVLVMIGGTGEKLGIKMKEHYSDIFHKRWYRLQSNLAWSYLDTYFVLTKWDRIWSAVKENMRIRSAELQGQAPAPPILQQTRRLHQDTNLIISLREHLRIHKASVRRIIQGVGDKTEPTDLEARRLGRALRVRLEDTFQLLEYYEVTASSLLDQQQNLLGLAFNTETVSQGQAVARLNALAFIFLPLSFSASIWGITTFTVDAIWFPAFAIPLLVITIATAAVANAILAKRDSRPLSTNVLKTPKASTPPTVRRTSPWGFVDFGKLWSTLANSRSNQGYSVQITNDLESMAVHGSTWTLAPSIQSPPTGPIPYGMSPAYGLGAPSTNPSAAGKGPVQQTMIAELSATASTTALAKSVPRSSSLRSQRSFSWKKGEDDLGSNPMIQEYIARPSASATVPPPATAATAATATTAPFPSLTTSLFPPPNTLSSPTAVWHHDRGAINAVHLMDHTTLETILEQNTPLAPSADLAHFADSDVDISTGSSSGNGKNKGKQKE